MKVKILSVDETEQTYIVELGIPHENRTEHRVISIPKPDPKLEKISEITAYIQGEIKKRFTSSKGEPQRLDIKGEVDITEIISIEEK